MSDSSAIGAVTAASREPNTSTYPAHPASSVPNKTPTDVVALSRTAQAILLNQQGLTAAEIAQVLNLPVSAVQEDLGIAITSNQTKAVGA